MACKLLVVAYKIQFPGWGLNLGAWLGATGPPERSQHAFASEPGWREKQQCLLWETPEVRTFTVSLMLVAVMKLHLVWHKASGHESWPNCWPYGWSNTENDEPSFLARWLPCLPPSLSKCLFLTSMWVQLWGEWENCRWSHMELSLEAEENVRWRLKGRGGTAGSFEAYSHIALVQRLVTEVFNRGLEWLVQDLDFRFWDTNSGVSRSRQVISHASKVMLKILQARLQQYVNCELPDVQAGFRKGRGTRDQIANIRWIMEKAREF